MEITKTQHKDEENNMKTAVVTDSAAYLSPEQIKQFNLTVMPITVIFDQQAYLENIDIDAPTFFKRMRTETNLPTTAQITMAQMAAAYDKLADEGYDEVISIHLSSGITSFFDNLSVFAKAYDKLKVYPFDSKIASAGESAMAMLAGQMVKNGAHAKTIMPALEKLRATTSVYFMVDDLGHLLRTGRISNSSAFVGNLLRIKPLLTFNQTGQIVALGKERTMKKAFRRALNDFKTDLAKLNYPVRVTIIDANAPKTNQAWVETFKTDFPDIPVDSSHLGPVISVHTGEKTMGFVWAYDWEKLASDEKND